MKDYFIFKDSYDAAVHNSPNFSEVQKFTYIKSLVKVKAKRAIKGLATTDANYAMAMKTLDERFGNKQKVCFQYTRSQKIT